MGQLVDGQWVDDQLIKPDTKGRFIRSNSSFRDQIGPEHPRFQPESGRYHLYVSYACPWAHRTLIYRELKDLSQHIDLSVVHPDMMQKGWTFLNDREETTGDLLFGSNFLYQIYQQANPNISTKVTVPILWDKKLKTIVNNESSEIIRIFDRAFNQLTGNQLSYYPPHLADQIDEVNQWLYQAINNGVYKVGFSQSQSAYEESVDALFEALNQVEQRLSESQYLIGNQITEADWRLLPTLLRFDDIYFIHFKCSVKRIADYPFISAYVHNLLEHPKVAKTWFPNHAKRHYYFSHQMINPFRIIPKTDNDNIY